MHRIYQSTMRILAAQIVAIELLPEGAEPTKGGPQLAIKVDTGETINAPTAWAEHFGVQVGGFMALTSAEQAVYISAAQLAESYAYVGNVPAPAAPADEPAAAVGDGKQQAFPIIYDFDQFLEYGRNAANTTGTMPWSFDFHGRPVSHETDDRYVIGLRDGGCLNFDRGETITVREDGGFTITAGA